MSASSFARIVNRTDILSQLKDHANRLRRLQGILETQLPAQLHGSFGVANYQLNVLTIHVDSPAIASRLNMMREQIKQALLQKGELISEVKIKNRPVHSLHRAPAPVPQRGLTSNSREALNNLQNQLGDTNPLGEALARLLKQSG